METTFTNLTVAITSKNARCAYLQLCEALTRDGIEFSTDLYSTYSKGESPSTPKPTSELFPIR